MPTVNTYIQMYMYLLGKKCHGNASLLDLRLKSKLYMTMSKNLKGFTSTQKDPEHIFNFSSPCNYS